MAGRPRGRLVLTARERQVLESWSRRPSTSQAVAQRARIVLACAEGHGNTRVADQLGVGRETVGKWRSRFLAGRLDGLRDEPRPGAPRRITDEQVRDLLARTRAPAGPEPADHQADDPGPGQPGPGQPGPDRPAAAAAWSTRSMAAATGLSQSAVSRIWRASGVQPQVAHSSRPITDPRFAQRVRDIAGLYLHAPAKSLALCADQEPGTRTAGPAPRGPARGPAGRLASGQQPSRQRHQDFVGFLRLLDAAVPAHLDLHLICDGQGAHRAPAVRDWLISRPRFHLHAVPATSSWIAVVDWWLARLSHRPFSWIKAFDGASISAAPAGAELMTQLIGQDVIL